MKCTSTMASKLFIGLLLIMAAVTGCKQNGGPPPARVPEVTVMTVVPEVLRLNTELPGRTTPFMIAEIRPQVSGLIQKRLFEEGADVEADQALYQIDPAPFQAALDSAEASLARAEAGLRSIKLRVERYEKLLDQKAISHQDFDDASASMDQAKAAILSSKAAVKTAQINLGYTKITAPISGRIGKSSVTEGALVTAFQPLALATIQQLDPMYVDVPQSATQLLELRRKHGSLQDMDAAYRQVKLRLSDGTEYKEDGALKFKDVSVDPTTGSVILRSVFPNPDLMLLPGLFVRAVIAEGVDEQAILLPQPCVRRTPKGEPFVLLVDDENKVAQRMVTIERAVGNRWHVTAGLAPGEKVIVEGLQSARPGSPVTATPIQEEQPEPPANQPSSPNH
ncbi:MAG: efflux RND transporter periplasmic adaptor subunit [Spartobacteria bacterium]|nr:efflux RND transporter periplasmic adaptor subunit [Spartobacteria bacterium]